METSDSECFESADEDFGSDYEDNKFHLQTSHSHKVIEPELCKLKIDENPESRCEIIEKPVQDEEKRSHKSLTITEDHSKHPETNITEKETDLSSGSSKYTKDNFKDICDDNTKNDLLLEKSPSITLAAENIITETIPRSTKPAYSETVHIETKLKDTSNAEFSQEHTKEKPLITTLINKVEVNKACTEENLWDDDELDWGVETQKEEAENSAEPSTLQEGWGDFYAEWETDNRKSKQDSSSTTETSDTTQIDHQSIFKDTQKDDNLWNEDEDWESVEQPSEKPQEVQEESTWGSWGDWGVSSILNTATSLTSQVSQGFSTVLENSIGIPQPEELAKMNKEGTQKDTIEEDSVGFGLGNLVSGVSQLTKFMESTGSRVITGGLDTLELIGKKTVEVLQEGDPGFKKKRAFLKLDSGKPNLSQILREAKEKAEQENKESKEESIKRDGYYKSNNYETLFDDYQGIVHLEALEMLSKLCHIKLDNITSSLTGSALKDLEETLEQVKELSELPEDEENELQDLGDAQQSISDIIKEIDIPISFEKFFDIANGNENKLHSDVGVEHKVMHQKAIELLAQLTALAVEQFHKAGELLLVKEHRSTVDEADGLVQLTTLIKACIAKTAKQYADQFSKMDNVIGKEQVNEYITNIFYEAANSATYIQNAFQLLIPVLQVGAV
ncbi:protein FAM114A2 [Anthonomus grandis grandis]|uniref:protein FAM114A2 n=1 Tax=Anthonomus grandis grandis TaxID=2921223 RepID=UPI002165C29C|nr:protein FAM114A2 [Anthonomus grandis grandis]